MKYYLFVLTILCLSIESYGQNRVSSHEINSIVANSKSDSAYLELVQEKIDAFATVGRFFDTDTLKKVLKPYQELVFNHQKFKKYRIRYYGILANNASYINKSGEAIYFYEKLEQQKQLLGDTTSIDLSLYEKYRFYVDNNLYKKLIENYESNYETTISSIVADGEQGNVKSISDLFATMYLLITIQYSYCMENDTSGADKTSELTNRLMPAIKKNLKDEDRNYYIPFMEMLRNTVEYYKYRYIYKDTVRDLETINQLKEIAQRPDFPKELETLFTSNINERMMSHFILAKNIDSATYYFNQFKKLPSLQSEALANMSNLKYKYDILKLKIDNPELFTTIDHLLSAKDSLVHKTAMELENSLYEKAKAELSAEELVKLESKNNRRNTILIISGALVSIIAIIIFFRLRIHNKNIKTKIESINHFANLKVIAIEEEKNRAIHIEKEKMAQELHDDFSARAAAINHQIDILITEEADATRKDSLSKLQTQAQDLYDAARLKSHQWYHTTREQQQNSFLESVQILVDGALPGSRYKKNIELENEAIINMTFDHRINILRILQEALTNIIKHSKATEVSVFLFAVNDNITLQITDNGIGFLPSKNKTGLGIQSITNRVRLLNGTLNIINEEGTTLDIVFPKADIS